MTMQCRDQITIDARHVMVTRLEVTALSTFPLEAEDLVWQLADRSCLLVPKLNQTLLHRAHHWWWSADKYFDIVCRSWKLGLLYY